MSPAGENRAVDDPAALGMDHQAGDCRLELGSSASATSAGLICFRGFSHQAASSEGALLRCACAGADSEVQLGDVLPGPGRSVVERCTRPRQVGFHTVDSSTAAFRAHPWPVRTSASGRSNRATPDVTVDGSRARSLVGLDLLMALPMSAACHPLVTAD